MSRKIPYKAWLHYLDYKYLYFPVIIWQNFTRHLVLKCSAKESSFNISKRCPASWPRPADGSATVMGLLFCGYCRWSQPIWQSWAPFKACIYSNYMANTGLFTLAQTPITCRLGSYKGINTKQRFYSAYIYILTLKNVRVLQIEFHNVSAKCILIQQAGGIQKKSTMLHRYQDN